MVGTEWYLWKKKKLLRNLESNQKAETKLRDLSEQAQGAAPLPEVIESQPLKDLSPSQTKSQPLLYFIIYEAKKSIYKYNESVSVFGRKWKITKRTEIKDRNFQLFPVPVLIYCSFDDTIALNWLNK